MIDKAADLSSMEETRSERVKRFGLSGALRMGSAVLQAWGGVTGHEGALIIEAAEEASDAAAFAAASIEAGSKKVGVAKKARSLMVGLATAASGFATYEVASEVIPEVSQWKERLNGVDLTQHQFQAAAGAVVLNSMVFGLNRRMHGKKGADGFAFRDSLRDFAIPVSVLGLAAVRAPHIAEFAFEGGGLAYGWLNVQKLWSDSRQNFKPTKT